MATSATLKPVPLQPDDWINAAFKRLSSEGVESVRIEALARDLGASKGSFYWHFRDREDLLDKVLDRWQEEDNRWLEAIASDEATATRWAKFVDRCEDASRSRLEVSMRAWARQDERVANRVAAVEKQKAQFIAGVLREVGFAEDTAESWSALVLLVCLGWLDRASRDKEFQSTGLSLGEFLSDLVLAASSRATHPTR
jgi:AcrR family transcriptional regulator